MAMDRENKMLVFVIVVILGALLLVAIGGGRARGEEPPDEVVDEMHELVQRTCFDNQDLDPAAKDRCSLYVIRTLRDEYAQQQVQAEASPVSEGPPPGSEGSEEPTPSPTLTSIESVDAE